MKRPYSYNLQLLGDAVKLTLQQEERSLPIYGWMLEVGLKARNLLVYAFMFDKLRREPNTPQRINLADVARRLRTSKNNVLKAADCLVDNGLLHRKRISKYENFYSLYPFDFE